MSTPLAFQLSGTACLIMVVLTHVCEHIKFFRGWAGASSTASDTISICPARFSVLPFYPYALFFKRAGPGAQRSVAVPKQRGSDSETFCRSPGNPAVSGRWRSIARTAKRASSLITGPISTRRSVARKSSNVCAQKHPSASTSYVNTQIKIPTAILSLYQRLGSLRSASRATIHASSHEVPSAD